MTTVLLLLCVLAAADWLVLTVSAQRPAAGRRGARATVDGFARAMAALDPDGRRGRRRAP